MKQLIPLPLRQVLRPYVRSGKASWMKVLSKALAALGAFPTPATDREAILSLLRKLHPVSSDKGLVRMGPKGDGGYLVPNDLAGIAACFSPGVNNVSGFEKDCADLGIKTFLADKSVQGPSIEHELFTFTKKFVGATTDDDFMTMDGWVKASLPQSESDLLLQIDIEGYEYEVFLSTSDALMRRFRVIVTEFHSLDQLWSSPFFKLASRCFDKILQTHACVHSHPNNCRAPLVKDGVVIPPVMEFTFLRRDRLGNTSVADVFPHPLDYDNSSVKPPIVLPPYWFRSGK